MSPVFEVSDVEYATIERTARERGQDPIAFFQAQVASVRAHVEDDTIDPDQPWFLTAKWQAKERGADADVDAGRHMRYASDVDFLGALPERAK
jgi:hypothetical protein